VSGNGVLQTSLMLSDQRLAAALSSSILQRWRKHPSTNRHLSQQFHASYGTCWIEFNVMSN
jgi:hypothetical protein